MRARLFLLLPMVWSTSCMDREAREARAEYNEAVAALAASELESAQKGFLGARDKAGQDPELRFRAAYNLGVSYAKDGESKESAQPEEALGLFRNAAAWFRDAIRLRPEEDDPRVNLELVSRKMQLLADRLNKGKNGLEARLDRLIDDQRGLRDSVRQLMGKITLAGAEAEPVSFQDAFDGLATLERTLLSDAGAVSDLVGDELSLIENKKEEERSDEDKVRGVQLKNLDYYLQQARSALSDTRRLLRRLQGDDAHRRADSALALLKRAREQLLDPVTVLKSVVQDQLQLLSQTEALAVLQKGSLTLEGGQELSKPPWLTPAHLSEQEQDLGDRTQEVLARFNHGIQGARTSSAAGGDPSQARLLESASTAVPFLEEATQAMSRATSEITADRVESAPEHQRTAVRALLMAIERFSGIRDLIELAYGEQQQLIALITPPEDDQAQEAIKALSAEARARLVAEGVSRNRDRVGRLQGLFEDEVAKLSRPPAEGQGEADPQKIEQQKELYRRAEELRRKAEAAILRLSTVIEVGARASAQESPLEPAKQGLEQIEELRRLFFSLIEHLKELLKSQSDTHDKTASIRSAPETDRASLLGPVTELETRHAEMGSALATAFEEQADAAAQASGDPNAQQAAQRLGEAAPEVRSAAREMGDAREMLEESKKAAETASVELEPSLAAQQRAIEHLEKALEILEPPKQDQQQQDQQQQDQQQQDQQQQDQQQQDQQEEQLSRRQAERRLQAIRDREAERQKERRTKDRAQPEPVEKDW